MKKWIVIALAALTFGAAGYFGYTYIEGNQTDQTALAAGETVEVEVGSLTSTIGATGTVRSNQSANLVWETSGTVSAVYASVGDHIEGGQVISELALTSLPQNVIMAQSDLVSAEQQLDDLLNSQTQGAGAQKAVEDAEQALEDALYPELAQANALQAIADAEKAVENALRKVNNLNTRADQTDIDIAKAELALAEKNLERAEDIYEPYENKPETNLRRAQLLSNLAKAQQGYDSAVRTLNAMQGTGSVTDKAVADADLATAQANLLESKREYERIKDGATPGDIALLEANLADAQREWERLKDGPTVEDIASAQARVTAAEATLSQGWIEAPFSGTITLAEPQIGDQAASNMTAYRLDDLSTMYVDLEVSEIDINHVEPGQQVTISFDAIRGIDYRGEVVEVGLVGGEIQGVVNFTVTVELLDANNNIRPGMTSSVEIIVHQSDESLLVPNQAVRVDGGVQVVYVLGASGEMIPVEVKLGLSSNTHSEVLAGDIRAGDSIATNPTTATTDESNSESGMFGNMEEMRELDQSFEDTGGF